MKKVKQFIAVFMTAVFIAGTFPLTLSAADTRSDAPMVFAGSDTETVEDAEKQETGKDAGKQAETETAEDLGDAVKQADTETAENAGKQAEAETGEEAGDAGKQAEAESAEDAGKQAGTETGEDAGKQAETETAEDIEKQATEKSPGDEASGPVPSGDAADGGNSASGSEKRDESASSASDGAAVRADQGSEGSETYGEKPAMKAAQAVYTVTLDANGGGYYIDYSNHNARVQTVTHTGEPEGRDISVYQIPKANPGKIFAGWSTSANGKVLPTGTTVTKNLYLYAIWEQGCAVTLDANGGHFTLEDGSQSTSVMATVAKGDRIFSYSFVSSGEPEADGKRLAGYGRMVNGSVQLLPSTGGTGYTVTEEKLTLYAVWINVCEITYDANGGGYFTGLIDETAQSTTFTETLDEGEKVYNMNFINLVAYDGCIFLGWSLKADGSEMVPSSGYTVAAGALTLYAVWDGLPAECTITYDANGGNFPKEGRVRPTKKTMQVTRGEQISLLDPENYGGTDPSKTNCTFMGWSFAADSIELIDGEAYTQYTVTKDLTLYAVWTTTLTFNANGGSFKSGEIITDTIFLGTTVDLSKYEIPEKSGFLFGGWAESDSSSITVPNQYAVDEYNVNPFLYATWGRDFTDAKVTLAKTQMPFTRAAQKPAVTVTYGDADTLLEEGADYTLTYTNNTNAGTASVVVRGVAGKYTGSITKTFTITRIPQTLTLKAAAASVIAKRTVKVTAGGAKETASYTFTSSSTAVATVASSGAAGTVTGVKGGMVTITVTTPQTTNYLKGTKSVSIVVIPDKPGKCRFVKWQNTKYSKCLIAWNQAAGATGYQTLLTWTDGSHAVTKNLGPGVLQQSCDVAVNHVSQFKVRAYTDTAAGRKYSAWSNLEYITPSPSKLTVKKETPSSGTKKAKISWNIIYGCNGYNVFVTTNPNGTWYWNQSTDTSAKSTGAVISSYRGSKLKKGKTYYVRIVTRRKRNGVFCTVPMPAKNTYVGTFRF